MRHAEDHTDPGLGPLTGIRVLELGQFLAGPFAGYMLGTFGADVIKVEPPGVGDGIRRWRKMAGDSSLWWHSLARNKRCITCDLRKNEGRDLIKQLVAGGIDIVIESFRPGRMEAWGLGYEVLRKLNNGVIMVRVSGYGQTGPLSDRPGFANVAEAFGGLRYVTGEPGRPQVRSGISIGDSLAGLHAAFGALAALRERDAISVFTRRHSVDEALMILGDTEIPCGPILSAAAIASDPHYRSSRHARVGHAPRRPQRQDARCRAQIFTHTRFLTVGGADAGRPY